MENNIKKRLTDIILISFLIILVYLFIGLIAAPDYFKEKLNSYNKNNITYKETQIENNSINNEKSSNEETVSSVLSENLDTEQNSIENNSNQNEAQEYQYPEININEYNNQNDLNNDRYKSYNIEEMPNENASSEEPYIYENSYNETNNQDEQYNSKSITEIPVDDNVFEKQNSLDKQNNITDEWEVEYYNNGLAQKINIIGQTNIQNIGYNMYDPYKPIDSVTLSGGNYGLLKTNTYYGNSFSYTGNVLTILNPQYPNSPIARITINENKIITKVETNFSGTRPSRILNFDTSGNPQSLEKPFDI